MARCAACHRSSFHSFCCLASSCAFRQPASPQWSLSLRLAARWSIAGWPRRRGRSSRLQTTPVTAVLLSISFVVDCWHSIDRSSAQLPANLWAAARPLPLHGRSLLLVDASHRSGRSAAAVAAQLTSGVHEIERRADRMCHWRARRSECSTERRCSQSHTLSSQLPQFQRALLPIRACVVHCRCSSTGAAGAAKHTEQQLLHSDTRSDRMNGCCDLWSAGTAVSHGAALSMETAAAIADRSLQRAYPTSLSAAASHCSFLTPCAARTR